MKNIDTQVLYEPYHRVIHQVSIQLMGRLYNVFSKYIQVIYTVLFHENLNNMMMRIYKWHWHQNQLIQGILYQDQLKYFHF
jgi:hypothetical protein